MARKKELIDKAVEGTAIGIGMLPVATAGAVAGLAVYVIKKVFEE